MKNQTKKMQLQSNGKSPGCSVQYGSGRSSQVKDSLDDDAGKYAQNAYYSFVSVNYFTFLSLPGKRA